MPISLPKLPPGYTVRFADEGHAPIKSWSHFLETGSYSTLGSFFEGTLIGTACLAKLAGRNTHTDAMELKRKFRRKGHGIWLYVAVIREAKKLGAIRIYSSWSLNKFSRRMWREKLAKFFAVTHTSENRKEKVCHHCGRGGRFFIKLK